MTIWRGNRKITKIYRNGRAIASIFRGSRKVWSNDSDTISCFSNGYWNDSYPWDDTAKWQD
jgi:hypothetical protein